MKTPRFWSAGYTTAPALLAPLSVAYRCASSIRKQLTRPEAVSVPVICVGNITAGGAGKTPTAIAIGEHLLELGLRVSFLSRGYGGNLAGPVKVHDGHTVHDVGDEAILLSRTAPTWIARNRLAGARAAAPSSDLIVMDDGYQNWSITKDLGVLVIDAGFGFGNNRLLPAGPLRESVSSCLKRADAVLIILGPEDDPTKLPQLNTLPVYTARLVPRQGVGPITEQRVLAFCGIGRPEKFYSTLRSLGITITATHSFPDHHVYSADEIMQIVEEATARDAIPITTEKDWVRLPNDARLMIKSIGVELEFASSETLRNILEPIIRQVRKKVDCESQ